MLIVASTTFADEDDGVSEVSASGEQASGSDTSATARERIGLVLGGGSARGLAHIGVIQALEELRVPVDVVAGSSMGSVVGALYASGYSGAELETFANEQDWTAVFDDSTVRERATFRRKSDQIGFLADTYASFQNGKLVLPDGVVQGQSLWLTLSTLLVNARAIGHFDDLPIPFRAVAMDLSTGEAVILEKGDLAAATVASMALPGLIPPIEIGGRRLIDGGFVDNLPVSTARDMGGERLLVVSVGSDPLPADSIKGFSGVLRQTQKLLTDPSVREQRASLLETDILIEPVLDEFGFASFADSATMIERGRSAVFALETALLPLSLDEQTWQAHIDARARIRTTRPIVKSVEIRQNSNLSNDLVREFLSVELDELLDPVSLNEDIEDLYATGLFERISYDVDSKGQLTLLGFAYDSDLSFYRFGLSVNSDIDEQTQFALGLSFTRPQLNSRGGEYRLQLSVGDQSRLKQEFYQPFGPRQRFFVEPSLLLTRDDSPYTDDGDVASGTQRDALARLGLDAGVLFARWGEFRIGFAFGASELEPFQASGAQTDNINFTNPRNEKDSSVFAKFTIDTLDELSYPHVGVLTIISRTEHISSTGGDFDYSETELLAIKPLTFGANTLTLQAAASVTDGPDSGARDSALLGGFLQLSGFPTDSLRGQHMLLFSGTYYRRFNKQSILFDLPMYIGGSIEAGDVFRDRDDISLNGLTIAGSAFIGLDSVIGPVYLGYGKNDQNSDQFYFSIGSFFR